jgi:hypothetical protein
MIEIWAACQDSGDMGPVPVGYFATRELAKECAVREFRASDEAQETDYEDGPEERKVKRDMGIPVHEVPVYNVSRVGFRPQFRGHPDGDLQLAVWKNTGHYGPGWHITDWLVERISVLDALEPDEEARAS